MKIAAQSWMCILNFESIYKNCLKIPLKTLGLLTVERKSQAKVVKIDIRKPTRCHNVGTISVGIESKFESTIGIRIRKKP